MSSATSNNKPNFFTVIVRSDYQRRLQIPPGFSRDYGSSLPRRLTIRTEDGRTWTVKYERALACKDGDAEYFYFTEGWNHVAVSMNLQKKEFLVFTQISRSIFDMVIYWSDGCNRLISSSVGAKDDHGAVQRVPGPSMPANSQLKSVLKLIDACTRLKRVDVPKSLADALGIDTGEGSFRLENEQGRQWTVYLRARRNNQTDVRYFIKDGWTWFMFENNFVVGDILLFQCIPFEAVKVLMMAHAEGIQLLAGAGKGGVL